MTSETIVLNGSLQILLMGFFSGVSNARCVPSVPGGDRGVEITIGCFRGSQGDGERREEAAAQVLLC